MNMQNKMMVIKMQLFYKRNSKIIKIYQNHEVRIFQYE